MPSYNQSSVPHHKHLSPRHSTQASHCRRVNAHRHNPDAEQSQWLLVPPAPNAKKAPIAESLGPRTSTRMTLSAAAHLGPKTSTLDKFFRFLRHPIFTYKPSPNVSVVDSILHSHHTYFTRSPEIACLISIPQSVMIVYQDSHPCSAPWQACPALGMIINGKDE